MERPALRVVSHEMRELCSLIGEEMLRWPGVSTRPMFGMRAFYRGDHVFAMLPDKRALRSSDAIAYKLATGKEKREGEKWKFFAISDAAQISAALAVLDEAYRKAARSNRKQPGRK